MGFPEILSDSVDWRVQNFTKEEVACNCCGQSYMSGRFMSRVQRARAYLGIPIYGTSWCRCEDRNAQAGGLPDSAHLFRLCDGSVVSLSCAGDLTLANPRKPRPMTSGEQYSLRTALYEAGFNRFGRHPWYIHTDLDPNKPSNVEWFY